MDEDDDALQAELLRTFDQALTDLMASDHVSTEYWDMPSGSTAFHVYMSLHARDILGPLAERLGSSVNSLIHRFQSGRAVRSSLETH